jgi:outer membrane protein OmpA-like peptidoglycan-associated protein
VLRQCACSAGAEASGEGEEFRRERSLTPEQAILPRLAVNRPGDVWEQEADRAAEAALRAPVSRRKTAVGPGAGAESPAALPVLRKVRRSSSNDEVPPSVQEALASSGQLLEAETRTFMEARFGYDFGQVRVHIDRGAAQSAREMNALAYTVGQDVVFGAGQYAPRTVEGQKLLAHELAHTLQQEGAMPLVRRQASNLRVEGLYEGRAADPDFVYFNLDRPSAGDVPPESVLDPGEEGKIRTKVQAALAANTSEMSLYGFASEEGTPADNNALIKRRLNAVTNVLVAAGFAPPRQIHATPNLACSAGKYDYRMWRAVEMQPGTAASTRSCARSTLQPAACPPDQMTAMTGVITQALALINGPTGALARLDRFIHQPADEPGVSTALDTYFGNSHTVQTARAVRERVVAIRDFLSTLGTSGHTALLCGSADEPTCHTGSPANESREHNRVTVCPNFFTDPEYVHLQKEILIHESSHGSRIATDDRAYQSERVILILSTQQALANAQSLTDFILEMNGQARPLGPENRDVISGCDPQPRGPHERTVREALAWAERWNTYAKFGTAQTYGDSRVTEAMEPFIRAHGWTADRATIAGLYDRYRAMDGWFSLFYQVNCMPAADPACSGSRLVSWNLTHAVSPSGGGPLPEPGSASSSYSGGGATGGSATATAQQTGVGPTGTAQATGETATQAAQQTGGGQTSTTAASSQATTGSSAPTASTSTAPTTPSGEISVCPGFFSLGTLYDRVVELYSGLAVNMPGVSESTSRSFARLAFNYKVATIGE